MSLAIPKGEFVAIMGPSGSGKSTLMYALSGLDRLEGGEVHFEDRALHAEDEKSLADLRRKRMGFVFQQPTLLKHLSLLDNIIFPMLRDHRRELEQVTGKARELMGQVGIAHLERRDITQASGGQLQRAGICRSLMNDPAIIFADEPTGALDSASSEEVMEIFRTIHQTGTTIMLVTHDVKVAARAERILFLIDGRITGEYTHPEGLQEPRERTMRLNQWLSDMGN